jgi:CRP/FNR family transcriptional activator FtrB
MFICQTDIDLVRSMELFASMGQANFDDLMQASSCEKVAPRTVLFRKGKPARTLYLVLEGSVELFGERCHQRCTFAILGPTKPCAIASIFTDRYPLSARTLEGSQLLSVPTRAIHKLLGIDSHFARTVIVELTRDCEQFIDDLWIQKTPSSSDRVIHWLLRSDRAAGGTGSFTMPCNKRTLASYLGMTPESLSRSLSKLASEGVIGINSRRVTLQDNNSQYPLAPTLRTMRHGESLARSTS